MRIKIFTLSLLVFMLSCHAADEEAAHLLGGNTQEMGRTWITRVHFDDPDGTQALAHSDALDELMSEIDSDHLSKAWESGNIVQNREKIQTELGIALFSWQQKYPGQTPTLAQLTEFHAINMKSFAAAKSREAQAITEKANHEKGKPFAVILAINAMIEFPVLLYMMIMGAEINQGAESSGSGSLN